VGHFERKFQGNGASPINGCWRQKNKVPGLSRGVVCVIFGLAILNPSHKCYGHGRRKIISSAAKSCDFCFLDIVRFRCDRSLRGHISQDTVRFVNKRRALVRRRYDDNMVSVRVLRAPYGRRMHLTEHLRFNAQIGLEVTA